ncbi:NUDIX hydrolase [Halobacillus dabanensis]|nr:NUDIX hydrolase [Halobacillus dabanensis]
MSKWQGSAAICINDKNELLMVLQGKPQEKKTWTVPSGGIKEGETPEQCCRRETFEETGYIVSVKERLKIKNGFIGEIAVEVAYFSVSRTGGQMQIQDTDSLIHEIRWVSQEELLHLELSFPEDLSFLIAVLKTEKNEGVERA